VSYEGEKNGRKLRKWESWIRAKERIEATANFSVMPCVEVQMPTTQQVDDGCFFLSALSLTNHHNHPCSSPLFSSISPSFLHPAGVEKVTVLFRGSSFSACLWQHWITEPFLDVHRL